MIETLGIIVLWIISVAMILAFPLSEFARGMASSGQHPPSRGAMFISLGGLVLAIFLISGCSTPPVKDRIVEVVKPVAVLPIKPEQVPVLPSPLPPRPESLSAAADVLLGKWCEAVAYMVKADPLLRVSAGQQPGQAPLFPECEGGNR